MFFVIKKDIILLFLTQETIKTNNNGRGYCKKDYDDGY